MTLTYNDELKICRLYLQDWNISAVKQKTGRSRDTIRNVLRREKLYNKSGQKKKNEVCQWIPQKIQKGIVRVKDYRADIENRLRSLGNEKHHIHLAITGQAGVGKSFLSLHLARLIDPSFDISGVVFDRSHLMEAISSSPFKVLILDAAERIAASRDWRRNWMKHLHQVVAASRHRVIGGHEVPLALIINMPHCKDVAPKIRNLLHLIINIDISCGDNHIHALVHDPNRSSVALGRRTVLGELCYRIDEYDESLLLQYEKMSKQRSDVAIELDSSEATLVRLRHDKRRIKREINAVKGQLKEYCEDAEVSEAILMLEDLLEQVENVKKNRMTLGSLYSLFKQKLPEINAKLDTCSFNHEKNDRLAKIRQERAELEDFRSQNEINGETVISFLEEHYCGIRQDKWGIYFMGLDGRHYKFLSFNTSTNLQMSEPLIQRRIAIVKMLTELISKANTKSDLIKYDKLMNAFRNPIYIANELKKFNDVVDRCERRQLEMKKERQDAGFFQKYSEFVAFLKSFG